MKRFVIPVLLVMLALVILGCQKNTQNTTGQQPTAPRTPTPTAGPPTVVAKGKTIEEHVTDYFNAYKEQRLEDAFNLSPADVKAKQPLDQFVSLRKGMPISSFKLLPTQKQGNQSIVAVEYDVGQYGVWVSNWVFEKQGKQWVAVSYKANPKQ